MRKALAWAAAGTTITAGLLSMAATANAATFQPKAPTRLSVTESAPVIKAHGRDIIAGTLAEGRRGLAGETVSLDIVNGRRLIPAEIASTNRGGSVFFTVSPKATTTYVLVFNGTRNLAASRSAVVTVRVVR